MKSDLGPGAQSGPSVEQPIAARWSSGRFAPGTKGFTITLALSMAITALAIDSLLPAFDQIRANFGLAPTSTAVSALVTAFIGGLGFGQLPAGLLADRFGRRPVLWGGVALYIVGAVLSMAAPTLPLMIAARFVWGLGGAGPRVAAVAMVRDAYAGERMAKEMSLIMAVFLTVPMVAPLIGTGLLSIGSWRWTIGFCIATGLALGLTTGGVPPFWIFYIGLAGVAVCQQVLLTNINAAAMVPLGHVAGTGSAVLGLIPLVVGSALATAISAAFDGTITPFAWAYLVTAVFGAATTTAALRQAPLPRDR